MTMTSINRGKAETSIVSVRLTAHERTALSHKADTCRMALSAFIRASALNTLELGQMGHTPRPTSKRLSTTERTQIALVLACMARLMDSIRDFENTNADSVDEQTLMLPALKRDITATRDQCFKGIGRLP